MTSRSNVFVYAWSIYSLAPLQIWSLLLAHWSLDNNLWWSLSVAEVLRLRQSLHPQAPAGCYGCICNDIWRISDISVYMIHMQLCSLGAPVDWSCIKQFLSGWLNLSCSIWHLDQTHESVPDCEIFQCHLSGYDSLISAPPSWFSCIFLSAGTVIRGLTGK